MADISIPAGSVASYRFILSTPPPIGRRVGGAPVYASDILGPVSLDVELTFTTDNVFTLDSNDYNGDTTGWIEFVAKGMDLRNRILVPMSRLGYETPDGAVDKALTRDCDAGSTSCRVQGTLSSFKIGSFVSLKNELKLVKGLSQPSGGRIDVEFEPLMLQDAKSSDMLGIADPTGAFLPSGDLRRLTIDGLVKGNIALAGETHTFLQAGPQ